MKKLISILVCLMLVIGLAACGEAENSQPATGDSTENSSSMEDSSSAQSSASESSSAQSSQSESSSEVELPSVDLMGVASADAFLGQATGIWFMEDSVSWLYGEEYMYTFCSLSPTSMGSGVYPGGIDRPGVITDAVYAGERTFELSLLYEAGEYMGEVLAEERVTVTVAVLSASRIRIGESVYRYGGADLDQAQLAVRQFVA